MSYHYNKSAKQTNENFEDSYCKKFGKEYYYQGECNDSRRNCLDKMYYSDNCPNVYSNNNAVEFLINRFNEISSKEYGKIDKSYFDSYESIKEGLKKSIEYQKEIDLIKELPIPPVDTELVYGSFYKIVSALVLDDNDFTNNGTTYEKGGDGTVPTWSSLLTGLKWIYDKKKKNLTQKIKLIEYCSRLAKSGQYKYNQNQNQNFAAINCKCLNELKNEKKEKINACSHAEMLSDKYLFQYIYSVVNNHKENIYDNIESKKEVVKNYNSKIDYEQICNNDIYNIFDNENYNFNNESSDLVNNVTKSTCKIEYTLGQQNKVGKGFLVSLLISDLDNPIRGIMTTNNLLDINNLYNSTITVNCNEEQKRFDLIPQEHFCFSDPLLDITFIELKNQEFNGFDFLKIEEIDNNSENIYLIKDKQIFKGKISDKYGFKLYHDISLEDDYSYSALFSLDNNKVIRVYK